MKDESKRNRTQKFVPFQLSTEHRNNDQETMRVFAIYVLNYKSIFNMHN